MDKKEQGKRLADWNKRNKYAGQKKGALKTNSSKHFTNLFYKILLEREGYADFVLRTLGFPPLLWSWYIQNDYSDLDIFTHFYAIAGYDCYTGHFDIRCRYSFEEMVDLVAGVHTQGGGSVSSV